MKKFYLKSNQKVVNAIYSENLPLYYNDGEKIYCIDYPEQDQHFYYCETNNNKENLEMVGSWKKCLVFIDNEQFN